MRETAQLKKPGRFSIWCRDIDENHLDVLDGFRVLMMFVVSWFHIWQQSWLMPIWNVGPLVINLDFIPRSGYMAVDGLIFLSGLLIMYPCTRSGARAPGALSFYRRRLIRILPGYLLVLAVSLWDALAHRGYNTAWECIRDLLAHLTFTHTLFPFSYTGSPLNGVLWTLSVEVQFYLLFPLVARAYMKHPVWTALVMTGIAHGYRTYVSGFQDTSLYINQLPAFLDTYAWGFFAASAIRALRERLRGEGKTEKCFFTACAFAGFLLLVKITQAQAGTTGIEAIRLGQMNRRFLLSFAFFLVAVGLCFSLPAARFLFGNRVMHFLSLISFQYYMWHQMVTLHLKEWGIPPSVSVQPWVDGERGWQWPYVLLCFGLSVLIAALITFLYERPLQKWLRAREKKKEG